MTRVLSVTSECVPLIKTGGLADVAGALPAALAPFGVGMRTLLPGYRVVMAAQGNYAPVVMELDDLFGGPARIRRGALGDAVLYILDAPHLFDRDGGPYLGPDGKDWPDNPQRFAALDRAAAIIARDGIEGWRPQILHLHDWQAGLAPVYLRQLGVSGVKCLLTIHNIAFQGLAPAHMLAALQLPAHLFTPQGFEYWGRISALKAGIVFADKVSTVSPTYAEELMTPEFGMGMEGVLADRGADFIGILNGIDLKTWTPPYSDTKGKARARAALRAEFGLPEAAGPLCVVISRLSEQKGLDLLIEALPALIENGGQLAVLGAGDPALEAALRAAAGRGLRRARMRSRAQWRLTAVGRVARRQASAAASAASEPSWRRARAMPKAAVAPISGAPRTCMSRMATAASARVSRRTKRSVQGRQVWSRITTSSPSRAMVGQASDTVGGFRRMGEGAIVSGPARRVAGRRGRHLPESARLFALIHPGVIVMPRFPAPVVSRLPAVGTTIFTVMSRLAQECGAINLSQGFPDFNGPQALLDAVGRHVAADVEIAGIGRQTALPVVGDRIRHPVDVDDLPPPGGS